MTVQEPLQRPPTDPATESGQVPTAGSGRTGATALVRTAGTPRPPAAPLPTGRLQLVTRLVRAHPDRVTALAVFALTLVLGWWNVTGAPAFADDEGTYLAQAVAVQNGALAPYTYWYDHPPGGWILLGVLGWLPQALFGGSDLAAMRHVTGFLFAVAATGVYALARRLQVRRPFALLAVALFAFSPLSLSSGRQVYLDVVALPWILLALYLAASLRRALWHHVGAGAAFAIAVLCKVTLAAFGPAVLVAMLGRGRWRGRAFSMVGFFGMGSLVLALYPVMALLRGELLSGPGHVSLQDGLTYQFVSRSGSGWIWQAGSDRQGLLFDWLQIDSFLPVAGVICAGLCLFGATARWVGVAVAGFAVPVVLGQGYLPAMYLTAVLPLLALAIAVVADRVWRRVREFTAARRMISRPRALRVTTVITAAATIAVLLFALPASHWAERGTHLLTADENADWERTLAWVDSNLPRTDTVVVPYSMWHDVHRLGWDGPWSVIALEKVDLDEEFVTVHPGGWRDIEWIVEGPSVAANIDYLGLSTMAQAYENSEPVQTFGDWTIRRVKG